MRNVRSDFVVVLFIILGLLISIQVRTIFRETEKGVTADNRYEQLHTDLLREKNNVSFYISELEKRQKSIDEYEKEAGKKDTGLEQLILDTRYYKMLAGLTDVVGPGVVITLDDSKVRKDDFVNPSETIIHDLDIIALLNELKAAGAEAISINNERITSASEQVCAGPTIRINSTRHTIPFTILAIGDRNGFKQMFEEPYSIINVLKFRGIMVDIKYSNNIKIPKYKGSIYLLTGKREES